MPTLTRRRYPERPDCWHIYYGDVQAGTVARRVGNPFDTDPWEWNCGFYPGSHPGECGTGTSATFDQARADFEQAWEVFLSKRTEADFREWRDARDWHARKYAMWARGEKMPSQKPSSLMRCPCGEKFDSHDPARSYVHRGHIYAAHAADGIRRQMRCLLCEDCGWVCEAHPDRPWEGEHACRCGGAGAPCPHCNASEDGTAPRMPKGFKTEFDKKGWRH
jgi:hypothetical protein